MSSPELRLPPPLPTPELYQKTYIKYEEAGEERINTHNASIGAPEVEWNAWVDVMSAVVDERHLATGRIAKDAIRRYQTLTQLSDALVLPEIDNSQAQVQHSFARGFLQQQRVINMVYGEKITFKDTFTPVAEFANSTGGLTFESTEDMHEFLRERVKMMGRLGLEALEYSRGFIEKWAQEVYTPATPQYSVLQDIFKMGHGVAIFGARTVHEQVNQTLEEAGLAKKQSGEIQSKSDNSNTGDTE